MPVAVVHHVDSPPETGSTAFSPERDARSRAVLQVLPGLAVRLTLTALARIAPGIGRRTLKGFIKWWYQRLSSWDKQANITFMNYGYASLDLPEQRARLCKEDEGDRYCLQLYDRVAGAVDLRNTEVLEVGSGRGGGASFVMRYLGPRSVTGVDLSDKAVAFCHRHYRTPELSFSTGDAEDLPFAADTFDAVINVESSHCYPSMDRFLQEVTRVLRPRGYLLFADLRPREAVTPLREQFKRAGLLTLQEELMTPNVLRALELDSGRRLALVQRHFPRVVRPQLRAFAGVKGTLWYERFRAGRLMYLRFVLQKAAEGNWA